MLREWPWAAYERGSMVGITASLHALIHADANCLIGLEQRTMVLFGIRLSLEVKPNHNG